MEIVCYNELQEDISIKIQTITSQILEGKRYSPSKVGEWIDMINNQIIELLKKLSPNFKYLSNCIIHQKTGAGLHYNCISHWDSKHDGVTTIKYENDSLTCIVVVFGLSL